MSSICSSDRPVVSGTKKRMIIIYGTHMAAKSRNVPAGVSSASSHGVSCPIRYVPIHSENPAIDMARPRTLVGYISESSTQMTAHMDIAQEKM